jgi:hypothetical protein
MLLDGEDGTNYDRAELGLFKSVLSAAKKVGGTAVKVATAPITKVTIPLAKTTVGLASKVPLPLAAAFNPLAAGQLMMANKATGAPAAGGLVQEVTVLPACGFWSRLKRAFGGNVTDCQ